MNTNWELSYNFFTRKYELYDKIINKKVMRRIYGL